jgi:crossover junction endodeoxyribonuclease RuvC
MRILGIDPGLQKTGWGIIEAVDNRLTFVQCGLIRTQAALPLYARLAEIDAGLAHVIALYAPGEAAIEITFVNENPASALKLGVARGAAITCPARHGLSVAEYAPNLVKKSLVGTGHASKDQVGMMIKMLLPTAGKMGADEADALAIAICHAHHATTRSRIGA